MILALLNAAISLALAGLPLVSMGTATLILVAVLCPALSVATLAFAVRDLIRSRNVRQALVAMALAFLPAVNLLRIDVAV